MNGTRTRRGLAWLVALLAALALLAAACGGDGGSDTSPAVPDAGGHMDDGHMDDGQMDDGRGGSGTFAFGEPADAAEADRVIDIEATDELRFDPDEVEIAEGETVTFRVRNAGKLPHDFTIGDAETQDDHDREMAAMGAGMDGHDEVNAVSLPAGETKELTWRFAKVDGVLFGCHVPGHYDAGMKGRFTPSG